MEVRKLYYEDGHLKEFVGVVTGCTQEKKGWLVTLDATAFYPEGGGQACDLGQLGQARVLDVQERDGDVVHLCDRPLEVGQTVTGTIDWQRRFDLMQQHSGEHMVSGVIYRKYGFHNVGFHMGAEAITIDFDGMIPPEELPQIEQEVNEALWQDLPVRCWVPSREELPGVAYRRKKDLPWPVRIVEIPGVDSCACCGVQVKRTGEIGMVKLLSCVKFHQGVRIEMVCGGRALGLLRQVYEQNRQVSQAFSAKILETGEAARRMNEQLAGEKFRAAGLEKRLFGAIAEQYAGRENVLHFEEGLPSNKIRELADTIARSCTGIAVVLSGSDGEGYGICMISQSRDVGALGAQAAKALNGRGGGRNGAYQGSVKATRKQVESFFAFA